MEGPPFLCTLSKIVMTTYSSLVGAWLLLNFKVKIPQFRTVVEILICNFTFVLFAPLLISLIVLNLLVRKFISKFLLSPQFQLIKGIDAVWAPVYPFTVPNFTSLYVVQGTLDLDKIQSRFESLLKRSHYVKLNYRVIRKFGFYCWEDMRESFDLKQHVKIMPGCEKGDFCSEDELFEKIKNIYDDFMPDDKPQWEILLIPRYKYNKADQSKSETEPHYAILYRMHHSILDGVSAGSMLQYGIGDYPVKLTVDPLKPFKSGSIFKTKILPYVLMAIVGPRSILKSLMLKETNCFHGKKMTGPKSVGWSRPIDLQALKEIKEATRTSTTAVLVSSFGGSLRNLAVTKNLHVPNSIHAAATVAMLPYPDITLQNRFTSAHVPIDIGLKTPGERLNSAFRHANNMARSPDILLNFHMMQLMGSWPIFLLDAVMENLNSTMLLSNVPGPAEKVFVFEGDQLVDAVAWGPFKGKTAIGMVLFSYAGTIRAAVVADKVALPDPSDLSTLLTGFEDEISKLAKSAGISTNCFTDSNSHNS